MKFRQVKLETIAGQRSPLWCFGGPGPCGSCTRSAGGLTHGLLAAYAAALLAVGRLACLAGVAVFSRIADVRGCFCLPCPLPFHVTDSYTGSGRCDCSRAFSAMAFGCASAKVSLPFPCPVRSVRLSLPLMAFSAVPLSFLAFVLFVLPWRRLGCGRVSMPCLSSAPTCSALPSACSLVHERRRFGCSLRADVVPSVAMIYFFDLCPPFPCLVVAVCFMFACACLPLALLRVFLLSLSVFVPSVGQCFCPCLSWCVSQCFSWRFSRSSRCLAVRSHPPCRGFVLCSLVLARRWLPVSCSLLSFSLCVLSVC